MEYSCVDTSLSISLNVNPSTHKDETPENRIAHLFPILNQKTEIDQGKLFGCRSGKPSVIQEVNVLVEELEKASKENKILTEMLIAIQKKYHCLQKQIVDLMTSKSSDSDNLARLGKRTRKVKVEDGSCGNGIEKGGSDSTVGCWGEEALCTCKKPKQGMKTINMSRICVRTDASNTSLVVNDGHRWRKYGQKVNRNNSYTRAYYKCAFAPGCPVKKKVQRSAENPCVLVATYEGEHNHLQPFQAELPLSMNPDVKLSSSTCSPGSATMHGLFKVDHQKF